MKQFVVPASEVVPFSLVEAFLNYCETELGMHFSVSMKDEMLRCGAEGFVDGVRGWDSCDCRHLQFRPKSCHVSGCPNCVERATKALAQYAFYRWTSLFELSNSGIAVDFITFTVASNLYLVVASDVKKFQSVCYQSLCEYFDVSKNEELFVQSCVQEWGDRDVSDSPSPHNHILVSPYVFDKKSHLITRRLDLVGKLINRNRLLQVFNRPLLAIFSRRMIEAFKLPKDSVVSLNVNRRFASQDMAGVRIASAQLFHQLKYLYRAPITDVVKAYCSGRLLRAGSKIYVRGSKGCHLVDFTEARKAQLVHLLKLSGLQGDVSGKKSKSIVRRYERVLGFGAASKRKVGLVLKALVAYAYETNTFSSVHVKFVYKPFSKWYKEHGISCWNHSYSRPVGEAVSMSRAEAIEKYGSRLHLRVTFLERKQLCELELVDRSEN